MNFDRWKNILLVINSLLSKTFIINDLIFDNKRLDCLLSTDTWLGTNAPVVLTKA